MRWFIAFLIVANVILFFWVKQDSRPSPGDMRLPPPDVGRLRLLTELRPPTPGDENEATDPAVEKSPDPVAAPVIKPSSAAKRAQATAKADDIVVESVSEEADEKTDADQTPLASGSVEVVAAPDLPASAGAFADSKQHDDLPDAPAVVAEVEAGPVPPGPACARIGPFPPGDADELISRLPPNITLLSDVAEEYTSVERYYVIIPPLPSTAEGQKMMKQLADAGVTDTWLFRTGEYRNGISLGFFSRSGGARQRAADVAKKGFDTEIKEKTVVRERRWLLLKNRDGDDPGQSLPLQAGIRAENRSCP